MFSLLDFGSAELQKTVETCRELNVTVIAYSPIGQGLLTDKLTQESFKSNRPARMLRLSWDQLTPLRSALKQIADKHEKSMAQVAINWCVCHGTVPLVGCRSVQQVRWRTSC
jgi:pyridoxine 4-dehydrogenase